MKIAVMTWFHYDHYGTVLQAAALARTLRSFGHEVDMIDYYPGKRFMTLPETGLRVEIARRIRISRQEIIDPEVTTQVSGEAFDAFRERELTVTDYCAGLADLERLNDLYDCFVCGSDRIWLPINFDAHYYLDFVRDPLRMIAYAPSIVETEHLDPYIEKQMQTLIDRFAYLSVREESGRKYLDEVFGKQTQELADPTLLIEPEDWGVSLQIQGDEEVEHYLLACFHGSASSGYWDAVEKLAARLELNVRVIPVHSSDLKKRGVIEGSVGPDDFIALIQNADYICTDSYHAVLFALQFKKEFCCFERLKDNEIIGMNKRVKHILNAVGLKQRLYAVDSPLECFLEKIDYIPVDYKLDALKIKSREFLKESLEKVSARVNETFYRKRHILDGYSLCSGCGACAVNCSSDAIRMVKGENGFLRAVVDEEKCQHCEKCRQVCPFQGTARGRSVAEGKLLSYTDEEQEKSNLSSGGGFAGRLAEVLYDAGYHIMGCVYDPSGQHAKHILIRQGEDRSALEKMRGSKYMQSNFEEALRSAKETEGKLAVFGLPCQIAAAKRILSGNKDARYIELVCSGIPSYLLFEKYRRSVCGKNKMEEQSFALTVRYKQALQTGDYVRVTDGATEKIISGKKDGFSRMMESKEFFCETCYDCRWRDRSEADLRVGDYPEESSLHGHGGDASSVFCLTDAGRGLINELLIAGYWEGLHKKDVLAYLEKHIGENPPKPVFYDELEEKFKDDKVSLNRILNEYVRACERRKRWEKI